TDLTRSFRISIRRHELLLIDGNWYVTHSGLLRIAHQSRCLRITTQVEKTVSDPASNRWIIRATVQTNLGRRFTGLGDADSTNVSPSMRGAEIRIAETRPVNRALRKAYGIGICSVEEIGSSTESRPTRKMPPQPTNGNGNYVGPKVRDRLCQLI